MLNELGIESDEDDPLIAESQKRFEERHERMFPRAQRERLQAAMARYAGRDVFADEPAPVVAPRAAKNPAQERARKQKNKRKMESASRKANRRKRK